MDPRGLGLWDRQKLSIMEGAIWAMDHDEAGKYGYVSNFEMYLLTSCSLLWLTTHALESSYLRVEHLQQMMTQLQMKLYPIKLFDYEN